MPSRKLVFDQTMRADSQAIGNIQRTLMFFAAELDALGSKMPSLVVAELEQALIVSFICNNPHNYSAFLEERSRSPASWQVRRAEEYIEANWNQPITIEELARATSASARSLFHQFKRSCRQSPMVSVKEVRLRRAREMLERTDVTPSVTETALACGFVNLGHFAHDYSKRSGERPSETLRRRGSKTMIRRAHYLFASAVGRRVEDAADPQISRPETPVATTINLSAEPSNLVMGRKPALRRQFVH